MMKSPLQKIIDRAVSRVVDDIAFAHDSIAPFTESPIERLLFAAVYAEVTMAGIFILNAGRAPDTVQSLDGGRLGLTFQAPILQFRADFAFYAKEGSSGTWKTLVVECDGHDFHERTKEQAANDRSRDRAMQEAGYPVYRFTGSELYRDPCGCAAQIISWAEKVRAA